MTADAVVAVYSAFEAADLVVWIDGGWCVDALLGRQLRAHNDLDIAINWHDVPRLRELLGAAGYRESRADSRWNFVLRDAVGQEIDVHAFVTDSAGETVDGVLYPRTALGGTGTIGGCTVRCITPEFMVKFIAPWRDKWPEKYEPAIAALCERFHLDVP